MAWKLPRLGSKARLAPVPKQTFEEVIEDLLRQLQMGHSELHLSFHREGQILGYDFVSVRQAMPDDGTEGYHVQVYPAPSEDTLRTLSMRREPSNIAKCTVPRARTAAANIHGCLHDIDADFSTIVVNLSGQEPKANRTATEALRRTHLAEPRRRTEYELVISTFQQAEENAARWMRDAGFNDAMVTPGGPDGGVDVVSIRAIAQVKFETRPVGRPPLQRLYGVATAEGKKPLFFSNSGYTRQASAWADTVGIATFTYDRHGAVQPESRAARVLKS